MEAQRDGANRLSPRVRAGLFVLLVLGVAAIANVKFGLGLLGSYDRVAVVGIFVFTYVVVLRLGIAAGDFKRSSKYSPREAALTIAVVIFALWFFELGPYYLRGQEIPDRSWLIVGTTTAVVVFVMFRARRSFRNHHE
jgi:hypothetical protein